MEITAFNQILSSFNIGAECVNFLKIDNYFLYDLKLFPNTKVKSINKYLDEISLAIQSPCKPSIKVLYQEGIVRLEFAVARTAPLKLFDLFTNNFIPKYKLPCLLGQTVDGDKMWIDLVDGPHMLIAGTTGSGKSVLLHNIIANLFNYNNAHLFLMDPKNIEFSEYQDRMPSAVNVVHTYEACNVMLDTLIEMMESRYMMLRQGHDPKKLPYVVTIIDEFADLIMQDQEDVFFKKLCRLAQKCRAAKIHIILATQRPSVNIINGVIKANFPARISCRVASAVDSKIVLDSMGAENLLGKGDALIRGNSNTLERFQVAYTNATEVCNHFAI